MAEHEKKEIDIDDEKQSRGCFPLLFTEQKIYIFIMGKTNKLI